MIKLPLPFLLLLFTVSGFGQTNISERERVDGLWTKKGEKASFNGAFMETFENGKLKGKGGFRDGLLEGVRVMYYENGKVKVEKQYTAGQSNGKSTEYFENGKIKQEGEFRIGKEEGIWKMYDETGTLRALLTFLNGVQQGDYMEYETDGQLKAQYYFVNGKAGYSSEFTELTEQALALSRQYKNEEAIALYDKAIKLNPTVAQVYFNRGVCRSNSFAFEEAIKDYDKAIKLNPDYMEAYGNRGNAKINTFTTKGNLDPTPKQTESACEDFHKAVSLGDQTIGTEDMIYIHCQKNKKK